MKVIKPIPMTDGQLISSNVAEDDYAEWDVSTTYAADDFVISTTTHRVYKSVQGSNLGNDPTTDDGTWWTDWTATNRWKAFDQVIADQVSNSGTIQYVIQPANRVTGLAFLNLEAAEVTVTVTDDASPANTVYDETFSLVDDSAIIDWLTLFTVDLSGELTDTLLVTDFLAFPTYEITITIGDGIGTARVGEVVFGAVTKLGETLVGTTIGLTSFSPKERDDFGNFKIVPRGKSDPVDFQFAMPFRDAGRVKRYLDRIRDTPAFYFADDNLTSLGAQTYGFFREYEIPLASAGVSIVTLEIEGLT